MGLRESLLSKIFGSGTARNSQEKAEQNSAPAAEKQSEQTKPDNTLTLVNNHPIVQLYDLWRAEHEQLMPVLRVELDAPERLDNNTLTQELSRLRLALTSAGTARVSKAIPKDKDPDEPPPDLDAQCVVFITSDKLSAYIMVLPPVGDGGEPDEDTLRDALDDSKVCSGIDRQLLSSIPKEDISKRYFTLYHIAEGFPAVNGTDGAVKDMFPRSPGKNYTVDEYDRIDYASLNPFHNVEEGDVICEITYPTEGEPGENVLGQELPAKKGKSAQIPRGRHTELDEDGTHLIATLAGHVEFNGRTFEIKPVLEIASNVDYSTGNINFVGDVNIHGDVCSGFTVRSMGSIHVDGVIEAGTIEAGGDLVVAKGIIGNNETVIRAQRSIFSKYLENCSVYAHDNIQADFVINSRLYSNGEVEVKSGRGAIIGGVTRAGRAVRANIVGSMSETNTRIILGGMPCEEFECELVEKEIEELKEELIELANRPNSPATSAQSGKARMKLSMAQLKLEQLKKAQQEQLSGEDEEDTVSERLECDTAYAGTEITIGNVTTRLTQEYRKCVARLVDGEIKVL